MTALLTGGYAAFQSAQGALPINGPLPVGSAAYTAVLTAVDGAAATINANLATADGNMGAFIAASPGGVVTAPDALTAVTTVNAIGAAAQDLAGLASMSAFIGRMVANLNNASN